MHFSGVSLCVPAYASYNLPIYLQCASICVPLSEFTLHFIHSHSLSALLSSSIYLKCALVCVPFSEFTLQFVQFHSFSALFSSLRPPIYPKCAPVAFLFQNLCITYLSNLFQMRFDLRSLRFNYYNFPLLQIGPVAITTRTDAQSPPSRAHRPRSTTESGPRRHVTIDYTNRDEKINEEIMSVPKSQDGHTKKMPTIIKYCGQGKDVYLCGNFSITII